MNSLDSFWTKTLFGLATTGLLGVIGLLYHKYVITPNASLLSSISRLEESVSNLEKTIELIGVHVDSVNKGRTENAIKEVYLSQDLKEIKQKIDILSSENGQNKLEIALLKQERR